MFTKISHATGLTSEAEILFSTPFDYFFPDAARSSACLLPATETTVAGLKALGSLMADPGDQSNPQPSFDGPIPAIFTYVGQFIDHDLTARTDRDGVLSALGMGDAVTPLDPNVVVQSLRNGRRPQFDLDNVLGDGPAFAGSAVAARSESQILYGSDFRLNVFESGARRD